MARVFLRAKTVHFPRTRSLTDAHLALRSSFPMWNSARIMYNEISAVGIVQW